jgi:hypothetical protein
MPGSGDVADGLTRRAATASVWPASVSATARETSSLRSLQRYARPGVDAVAKLTADHDPARRRR